MMFILLVLTLIISLQLDRIEKQLIALLKQKQNDG